MQVGGETKDGVGRCLRGERGKHQAAGLGFHPLFPRAALSIPWHSETLFKLSFLIKIKLPEDVCTHRRQRQRESKTAPHGGWLCQKPFLVPIKTVGQQWVAEGRIGDICLFLRCSRIPSLSQPSCQRCLSVHLRKRRQACRIWNTPVSLMLT